MPSPTGSAACRPPPAEPPPSKAPEPEITDPGFSPLRGSRTVPALARYPVKWRLERVRGKVAHSRGTRVRGDPAHLLLLLGCVSSPALALGQGADRPSLHAGRIDAEEEAPVIDGQVTEASGRRWSRPPASSSSSPTRASPRASARKCASCTIERNLYIGIVCFDSEPDKIVVTQGRRDAELTDTDSVQVILDTFNDHQNAFLFGTNPLGLEHDGQIAAEGQAGGVLGPGQSTGFGASGAQRGQLLGYNKNWDGDWTVRSQITGAGLGDGDGDPAQDPALRRRDGPALGHQRDAHHPPEERAGVPRPDTARLQHLPGVAGRGPERPQPARAPRPAGHSLRRSPASARTTPCPATRTTPSATSDST